jgi:enoyl-CoA hydratase
MSFETLTYEKDRSIAKITLNRVEALNAINERMLVELGEVLDDIEEDENVRVATITGGGKAFAAGADIKMMSGKSYLDAHKVTTHGRDLFTRIENMGIPFIAAVNGFALGGGCEISMACDIRIASEEAKFGQPEINLGIIPGWGGTQRLTRLVGKGMAKKMVLTGKMIDANEAKRIGLVDDVVPADKLESTVKDLAEEILTKPPIAIKCALDVINKGSQMNLAEALAFETDEYCICFASEDAKEGLSAFIEKRKAVFKER